MKTVSRSSIVATLLLAAWLMLPCSLYISGCGTTQKAAVAAFQNSPTTQAVEGALFDAGVSLAGQPELAFLAGPAVTGLTAVTNAVTGQPNPTAISGANVAADASAIAGAVAAAVPTSAGAAAGNAAAAGYTKLMTGVTPSKAAGNQALLLIAGALTAGSSSVLPSTAAMTEAPDTQILDWSQEMRRRQIVFCREPKAFVIVP